MHSATSSKSPRRALLLLICPLVIVTYLLVGGMSRGAEDARVDHVVAMIAVEAQQKAQQRASGILSAKTSSPPPPPSCKVENSTWYEGEFVSSANDKSIKECEILCSQNRLCSYFNFRNDKVCHLFSTRTKRHQDDKHSAGYCEKYELPKHTNCTIEPGVWWSGQFIEEKFATTDVDCATSCWREIDCSYFNYRSGDQSCHHFASRIERHVDVTHSSGACLRYVTASPELTSLGSIRSYNSCTTDISTKVLGEEGDIISSFRSMSTGNCIGECLDVRCIGYSYNYEDNICILFRVIRKRIKDKKYDSGTCGYIRPGITNAPTPPPPPPTAVPEPPNGFPILVESFLCSDADYEAWRSRVGLIPCHHSQTASFNPPLAEALSPKWYCDKIGNPMTPYHVPFGRYNEDSLAIGLYSGESLLYSRAAICEDTWLSSIKFRMTFTAADERTVFGIDKNTLSVTTLAAKDPLIKVENEHTNAQRLQLLGLKELFIKGKSAEWFIIVGDDTYINTDFLLNGLEQYDSKEPLWLARTSYRERLNHSDAWNWIQKVTTTEKLSAAFPDWNQRYENMFEWTSGGTAWILSKPAARLYAENVSYFMKFFGSKLDLICYCPDLLTGLLLSLLGLKISVFSHMEMHPYAVDSKEVNFASVPEVTLYHYVQPARMISLDERVQHSKLDRLITLRNAKEVLAFAVKFIEMHKSVFTRRRSQIVQLGGSVTDISPPELSNALLDNNPKQFITNFRSLIAAHFEQLRMLQIEVVKLAKNKNMQHIAQYDIPGQ